MKTKKDYSSYYEIEVNIIMDKFIGDFKINNITWKRKTLERMIGKSLTDKQWVLLFKKVLKTNGH